MAIAVPACADKSSGKTHPLSRAISDPSAAKDADSVDLLHATDFKMTTGQGSGWNGYDVLKLNADGSAEYTFVEQSGTAQPLVWKKASFTIESKAITALRQLLLDINVWKEPKEFHADVADGTQWFVKIEASGMRKSIYCDNYFPEEIVQLFDFLHANVLEPHHAELKAAKALPAAPTSQESEAFDGDR